MNIQRPYHLPNCTLTLEGMGDSNESQSPNPDLNIILNARCQFIGINQCLEGGRAFLEALARAVSAYAQQCLSGIQHPAATQGDAGEWVEITPLPEQGLHRLTWHPPTDESSHPLTLDLTTVQLFDLVEAVDQFIADRHTLPDFAVTIEPLSRRYRQPDEPFVQRVVPATLGAVSLVVLAAALYILPIPEVRRPEPKPQTSPTQVDPPSNNPAPDSSP
ncbi:MAG: hypothetical protein RLZZ568_249 [Cyanobacteriota bacterium]